MVSTRLLLLIVSTARVGKDILEDVGQVDLEAEKAKRLLLQNDVEELMIQVEEVKRKYYQKEIKARVGSAILEHVGQADLQAVRIRLEEEKSKRLLLQNDVEVLMIQVEELKRKYDETENKAGGTTFPDGGTTCIRWGRTVCPGNGTELVYKGYMAGSEHNQTGDGTNHLCLPEDRTCAKYQDGTQVHQYRAHLHGTEYEIGVGTDYNPFSRVIVKNNVPCAVCRTTRSSSSMVPGRTNCYSGWTDEYSGYLVSNYCPHAAPTEYVCLDGDPESIVSGNSNQNGHLIYLVDVKCGSLPCPPYVNGRELACVICSK